MIERMAQFVRTRFSGWVAPKKSDSELYAEAQQRAAMARAFLDSDIVVQAYQGMLDKITDQLLNTPMEQKDQILILHARAQALIGLVLQMKVFLNDVEILDAEREKKRKASPDYRPETPNA